MADVTIIPPTQIQTVAAAGGQTQQNPPQPSLPPGTLVSGTIAGKDTLGNYLLKSAQGTFTLQSSTPLTYNSDVTIRIGQNAAGNTNARIITVNGEPFSQFSTPEPETADSVSPTLLTQTPETPAAAPPATANTAASVRAVVVSAPPPPQQSTAATLSAGNTVVVRLSPQIPTQSSPQDSPQTQAVAPPESSPTVSSSVAVAAQPEQVAQSPQPVAPQPVAPQQPTVATPASVPASAAPIETELPVATVVTQTAQVQAPRTTPGQAASPQSQPQQQALPTSSTSPSPSVSTLYSVYTKQSATPAPASPAQATPITSPPAEAPASATPATSAPAANTIPAQIVSTDENGTITLQTALGNVTVQAPALPGLSVFSSGTSVLLELQPPTTPAQTANPLPATLTELASSWQSLKDIVTLVDNSSPTAANALLARLPQVGPDFASSSTAFIATLLQGNTRKLLGDDTVDILHQNGRADLIEKFSAEVANLSSSFTAAPQRQTAGWQTLFLPFVYQEALQQARVYVKRDAPKKERASSKNSTADTRFVVEVDLSEIGPLQMDGLVRKKEQTTAFDLVIRSHHAFPLSDQKEIADIYAGAAELTGFKGSLTFQVTRDFSVKPLEEAAGEAHSITA